MLAIHHLSKEFIQPNGAYHSVLKDINLELNHGELGCLLGVSGSGKSTLLCAIAGFESISAGNIALHQQVLVQQNDTAKAINIPPEQRQVGLMFQDYALFPHLTVLQNIAFGLRKWSTPAREARCQALIAMTALTEHQHHYPDQLSGGQQQRVALARSIAPKPKLLLLDEPFSHLDGMMREQLSGLVRAVLLQEKMTALMVTHDQNEALSLADKVGLLHHGVIEQWGTPYELYHLPKSRTVAQHLGKGTFIAGVVEKTGVATEFGHLSGVVSTECDGGQCHMLGEGTRVEVLLRPDDVVYDEKGAFVAKITGRLFRGAEYAYTLQLPSGIELTMNVPSHNQHQIGDNINIALDLNHVVAFKTQ